MATKKKKAPAKKKKKAKLAEDGSLLLNSSSSAEKLGLANKGDDASKKDEKSKDVTNLPNIR